MSEKSKRELREIVIAEKDAWERSLKNQDDEIKIAYRDGMIDCYENILRWLEIFGIS